MNRFAIKIVCLLLLVFTGLTSVAQHTGNPLLPGYFADPTIKKFGDWYYIYATTDGVKLASGEPSVWVSRDLKNWSNYELDLQVPEGLTNCWAPDVLQGKDGRYYYLMGNCQFGCNIYGYVSDSPMGPFKPINNGEPVIPVGTAKEHLPALDAQFFVDDNGDIYAYFGTWCTSFGGMGRAKFNPENFTIEKTGFIPIQQIPKAFEAAYMLKNNGIYYLMYSAGDCKINTYEVHYAWAESPEGPFNYGANNPILKTNEDRTVDGPGHHSVLKEGNNYYMVYHRHDNPHSSGGMFRQVCIDKMVFSANNSIAEIIPTTGGIEIKGKKTTPEKDLAWGKKADASSVYHLVAPANRYNKQPLDYQFSAANAVDDNNGTLWKAASSAFPQSLTIDLGKTQKIKRIATQFEYATYFYQYLIEVSTDGKNWKLYADKTANKTSGSPVFDDNILSGRYVKLTVTGAEKPGLFAAVWNIRVYNKTFSLPPFQNHETNTLPVEKSTGILLADLDATKIPAGNLNRAVLNSGSLGGNFEITGNISKETIGGVEAVSFDGNSFLQLSNDAPQSLAWNAPFTVSAWVYNPEIGLGECLLAWNSRDDMLQGSYAALMYGKGNYGAMAHGDGALDFPYKKLPDAGRWNHILVTFDGMVETIYVNGTQDARMPMNLFVQPSKIIIGASGEPTENFSGSIARMQLFDKAFTEEEIKLNFEKTRPAQLK